MTLTILLHLLRSHVLFRISSQTGPHTGSYNPVCRTRQLSVAIAESMTPQNDFPNSTNVLITIAQNVATTRKLNKPLENDHNKADPNERGKEDSPSHHALTPPRRSRRQPHHRRDANQVEWRNRSRPRQLQSNLRIEHWYRNGRGDRKVVATEHLNGASLTLWLSQRFLASHL